MGLVAFCLGGIPVYFYGLLLVLSILLGLLVTWIHVRLYEKPFAPVLDMIMWALPVGLLFSRIGYVISHWSSYEGIPGDILCIWNGGLSLYGAAIGFICTVWLYCRWHHISLWLWLDILMPAIVLSAVSLAYIIRLTRQSISETAGADFVRTARAKGLTSGSVMNRHILRNSLIPVVTFIGADLGALMGGAIVTEGIFGINGVGGMLWQGIIRGEPSSVVSVTTALVLVYIVANLLVDLLYAVLDPRIRYA